MLAKLTALQAELDKKVSLVDLIVLGGSAAESFAVLEPIHDAYRNWLKKDYVVKAWVKVMQADL